jgi:conjugative relaxase-like TrwC/TraI family protein
MWMVVVMMRVITLKAAAAGVVSVIDYYVGLAEDRSRPGPGQGPVDYYLDPDEPAGRWWGSGRAALGVSGEVNGEDLRPLLEGRHPRTGGTIGQGFGDRSARAFDATFSAPKSVSALWALSSDRFVQAEVLAAHDAAVDAALGWLETHGSVTRRGAKGVFQVDTQGLTAALFRQHTSRTTDPQLHTHAVISAKVQDPVGKWLSLDARFLMRQQRTVGWVYDAALRAELTHRLGVAWERSGSGPIDLVCVPKPVRDALSQRTVQVEAKLADLIGRWSDEHDGADPDFRAIAALQRKAAVTSRPGKCKVGSPGALRASWSETAEAAGLDVDALRTEALRELVPDRERDDEQVIAETLARVAEEGATWLRADLARHIATLLPTGPDLTAGEQIARIDRLSLEAAQRCLAIGPERGDQGRVRRDGRPVTEHVTDRLLSSPEVLDQETRLQDWARARAEAPGPGRDRQVAATEAIAGHAGLVLLVGPAGTGKTRTVARAVKHLRQQRRPVLGLGPSGKAADVLADEAGCQAMTLAKLLTLHADRPCSRIPAGTTVVLDEAGMATTDDLAGLAELADHYGWRLVAVGDPAQLSAVGRGGVFAHWCDTLPHHELTDPRRFIEPWEARASLDLRRGDPAAAAVYDENQRLHTAHPAVMATRVARSRQRHVDAGRTVAITTTSTATAREINQAIQNSRGPILGHEPSLADGSRVRVGDRIATRRNHPDLRTDRHEPVRNRHTWTVAAIDTDGNLTAEDSRRGTVVLSADYVASHVELGWAVTGYGNQGDTVDIGIAVLEPGTTRNQAYVALTRGRLSNDAWLPDAGGTLDPETALAGIIALDPNRASALAQRDHLHRQAGIDPPALATAPPFDPNRVHRNVAIPAGLDRLHQHRQPPGPSLGL